MMGFVRFTVAGGFLIAISIYVFGCGPTIAGPGTGDPGVDAPVVEGLVSKVIVDDPHNGGWSGRLSDPVAVVLTVDGADYDLDGALAQAATVKPGDRVRIACREYKTIDHYCQFRGVVIEQVQPR